MGVDKTRQDKTRQDEMRQGMNRTRNWVYNLNVNADKVNDHVSEVDDTEV